MQQTKKIAFILAALSLFGIVIITLIASISSNHVQEGNGFSRLFPPQMLNQKRQINLGFNSYYVAGTTGGNIYLADAIAPNYLLLTNYNLADTQSRYINIPSKNGKVPKYLTVLVDSPNIYMTDGLTKSILNSTWGQPIMHWDNQREIPNFNQLAIISPTSYIFQTFDPNLKQRVLTKSLTSERGTVKFTLQKFGEGIFSTAGMLNYDKGKNRLIYVYYYHNLIQCLDTSLNLIFEAHTIDTTKVPRLKIRNIQSEKTYTLDAGSVIVNKNSCIDDNRLYVQSNLISKSDNPESFKSNAVIDVYALEKGHYLFSFYIPGYNGKKMNSFKVFNKTIIALYGSDLVLYKMRL